MFDRLLPAADSNTHLWIPQGITRTSWSDSSGITSRELWLRYAGAIKRTYQPKKRYRRRVHGFLRRMSTRGGARVLQNRRRKGRERLAQ
jgi:large subunit ribosomal protein L34